MTPVDEARDILRGVGGAPDDDIDLADAALALAAIDRPGETFGKYRDHLTGLARGVADAVGAPSPDLDERRAALNHVILDKNGYSGDTQTYDDIRNANLMRVIDRRKGLPVALGIVYIHAARSVGWRVRGLNFPGHFLIRLEDAGQRMIVDPFNDGRTRDATDLRDLLKLSAGLDAELAPQHYEPVGNRDILIRLQNNIKARHLQNDDLDAAERVIETMLLIAPDFAMLWRETGIVRMRRDHLNGAMAAFERYASAAGSDAARSDAARLIQKLRQRLN